MSKFNVGDRVQYTEYTGQFVTGTVIATPDMHKDNDAINRQNPVWAIWEDSTSPSWMPENRVTLVEPDSAWIETTPEEIAVLDKFGIKFDIQETISIRIKGGK